MTRLRVEVYRGQFGTPQAERLLWRAGFGPRPGEAETLAARGLDEAVLSLTRPGAEQLQGPAPQDSKGRPLAPSDAWGHDHCWWLDRMVRTSRPLVERMALVWHDWFSTSNDGVGSQRLMLRQNDLFRRHALGSFGELLLDVTKDPAMLLWLSGSNSTRWAPNENYARELMELFTLGARPRLHGARRARAGTGSDRLAQRLARRRRTGRLPLRPPVPRPRRQACLRAQRPLRLAGRVPPLSPQRPPPVVLRQKALELLRSNRPGHGGCARAGGHVRPWRLPRAAAPRGDPPPSSPPHRPADGEAARGVHRRAPPRARPRHRHRRLGLDRQHGRAAALLPPVGRGLGRRPLARHRDVPRPLDGRELRDAAVRPRH